MAENELWWFGPAWLRQNDCEWPESSVNISLNEYDADISEVETKRDKTFVMVAAVAAETVLQRYSSLLKCIRITAWCLRFKNNALLKGTKCSVALSVGELDNAKTILLKIVQTTNFASELRELKKGNGLL